MSCFSPAVEAETILVVPGWHNSAPGHWQSWFEEVVPHTARVQQENWEQPQLSVWAHPVRQALEQAAGPVWVVAHSFGCLASVAATRRLPPSLRKKIRGALLVAPADPARFQISAEALSETLPFPTRVVASANDPWVSLDTARQWAGIWGSDFINVGTLGHINIDSGHGPWPDALAHFAALRRKSA
ncbi:MAG: alpha/beta hydrolase [Zoogloeaceae bacterium]|jgi:predicted alpha/beta hydrolase family esterase|nr:alpha/beta hydrolase [Zoogloeaceae bacterium]